MQRKTAHSFFKVPLLRIPFGTSSGMTLMETLIIVALIALLASAFLASANYFSQINKGKDAKRKSDLAMLKIKLEDYYNDHNRYPQASEMSACKVALAPYLNFIPCDPDGSAYLYEVDDVGQWYRIYARLKYTKDPVIASLGCSSGCGPNGAYNYGVTSNNIGLVTGTGGTDEAPCEGGVPADCGSPDLCGQQGPCCPGVNYILTCPGTKYWCCPV